MKQEMLGDGIDVVILIRIVVLVGGTFLDTIFWIYNVTVRFTFVSYINYCCIQQTAESFHLILEIGYRTASSLRFANNCRVNRHVWCKIPQ